MSRVDLMPHVITTACVLHNLAIHEEQAEDFEEPLNDATVTGDVDDGEIADLADGTVKRQQIMCQIAR